jgi:hypothetical protein
MHGPPQQEDAYASELFAETARVSRLVEALDAAVARRRPRRVGKRLIDDVAPAASACAQVFEARVSSAAGNCGVSNTMTFRLCAALTLWSFLELPHCLAQRARATLDEELPYWIELIGSRYRETAEAPAGHYTPSVGYLLAKVRTLSDSRDRVPLPPAPPDQHAAYRTSTEGRILAGVAAWCTVWLDNNWPTAAGAPPQFHYGLALAALQYLPLAHKASLEKFYRVDLDDASDRASSAAIQTLREGTLLSRFAFVNDFVLHTPFVSNGREPASDAAVAASDEFLDSLRRRAAEVDTTELDAYVDELTSGPMIVPPTVAAFSEALGLPGERELRAAGLNVVWPDLESIHEVMSESAIAETRSQVARSRFVEQLFDEIEEPFQADDEAMLRDDDTLTWLTGPIAHRFTVGAALTRNGIDLVRVSVETDVLHDVPEGHRVLDLAVSLNQVCSSSALYHDPTRSALVATTAQLVPVDRSRTFELANLRRAALMQGWEVTQRISSLADIEGVSMPPDPRPSTGTGPSGRAFERLVADVQAHIYEPSAFKGTPMRLLVDCHPEAFLIANGDDETVVANVAYATASGSTLADLMASTTLAIFATDATHASYGGGLLVALCIPTNLAQGDVSALTLGLNRAESLEGPAFSSYGAWCEHPSRRGELAHCQFWPSAFAEARTVPAIATDLAFRSLWVGERLSRP